jgi:four helix bundle protein
LVNKAVNKARMGAGETTMRNNAQLESIKSRTKRFAVEIIRLQGCLPQSTESQVIGSQVVRAGTLVGAHFREAMRAHTAADFAEKLERGLEDLEETTYWLELLEESGILQDHVLSALQREASELSVIFYAFTQKAKPKRRYLGETADSLM